MARFYFHTEDGDRFPDEEGAILADVAEARRVAVEIVIETLKGRPELLWDTGAFRLICQDEDQTTLFNIEMTARMAR